eukprot:1148253-Pelagomonas_calceolata.AAC.5
MPKVPGNPWEPSAACVEFWCWGLAEDSMLLLGDAELGLPVEEDLLAWLLLAPWKALPSTGFADDGLRPRAAGPGVADLLLRLSPLREDLLASGFAEEGLLPRKTVPGEEDLLLWLPPPREDPLASGFAEGALLPRSMVPGQEDLMDSAAAATTAALPGGQNEQVFRC